MFCLSILIDAEIGELAGGQQLPGFVGDIHHRQAGRLAPAADPALGPDGAAGLVFQKMQVPVLGHVVPAVGVDSGAARVIRQRVQRAAVVPCVFNSCF